LDGKLLRGSAKRPLLPRVGLPYALPRRLPAWITPCARKRDFCGGSFSEFFNTIRRNQPSGHYLAIPVPQGRGGTLTPIIASRVTNFASRSSSHPSVPAGRRGNTR